MFLTKKKEAEIRAKMEKDREYNSMFKPNISVSNNNMRNNNSDSISGINDSAFRSVNRPMEKSENLY